MAQNEGQPAKINALLVEWRQGDIVTIPGLPFIHLADLRAPLTAMSQQFARENADAIEESAFAAIASNTGSLVIVSQTCDIVKDCTFTPTIQLAAVEKVDAAKLADAKRGSSVRYLFLPAEEAASLVANLDKLLTAEKSILVDSAVQKRSTVRDEHEARALSEAIARKFKRFAFPDDFNEGLKKFRKHIIEKSGKDSPEGRTYKAISEIRVTAANEWSNKKPELTFLFLFESGNLINSESKQCIAKLMGCFQLVGRFAEKPEFRMVTYEDITADAYRRSSPLDLDFISSSNR
ncbi:MAG: hypothetical protein ACRESZ_13990 [Methylococcales bacterium]